VPADNNFDIACGSTTLTFFLSDKPIVNPLLSTSDNLRLFNGATTLSIFQMTLDESRLRVTVKLRRDTIMKNIGNEIGVGTNQKGVLVQNFGI
jgi:hypothetical protein